MLLEQDLSLQAQQHPRLCIGQLDCHEHVQPASTWCKPAVTPEAKSAVCSPADRRANICANMRACAQVRLKYLELAAAAGECTDWRTLDARQPIPEVTARVSCPGGAGSDTAQPGGSSGIVHAVQTACCIVLAGHVHLLG